MSFDPAGYTALLAALAARMDDGKFEINSVATDLRALQHPLQISFSPVTQDVVLIAWMATYKHQRWGAGFVTDANRVNDALMASAVFAKQTFDAIDLRRSALGLNSPILYAQNLGTRSGP